MSRTGAARFMSVYTTVTADELDAWLARYALGALVELTPIAAGIENTNYFVTTERGRYVLTLYERLPAEELPFYLNLMAHLARAGVEVPAPAPDRTGALFSHAERPARGTRARASTARRSTTRHAAHCAAVGAALARLHCASQSYRARLTNRRGPAWWRQAARAVRPFLTPAQNELLDGEIRFQTGFGKGKLPKGAIHGDLFCDNVLFADGRVAGIIDFGFAATDFFAYDLAIAVNDWCVGRQRGRRARCRRADARDGAALPRRAAADRRRTRAMAGAAARRRAALLGVAALRSPPAAARRADARARSRRRSSASCARARARPHGRSTL